MKKRKTIREIVVAEMERQQLTAYALNKIDERIGKRQMERYVAGTHDITSETLGLVFEVLKITLNVG